MIPEMNTLKTRYSVSREREREREWEGESGWEGEREEGRRERDEVVRENTFGGKEQLKFSLYHENYLEIEEFGEEDTDKSAKMLS
jgi:hypothetical protein